MTPSGLDRVVNMAEFRLITGMSRHLVLRRVELGMPVWAKPRTRGEDYQFNLADCLRWLFDQEQDPKIITETGDVIDLNAERARLTKEQADKTELENRQLRGELIGRAKVEAALAVIDLALKDRLLTVPMAAAPEVLDAARDGGVPAAVDVLARHINRALADFAGAEVVARVAA